MRLDSFLAVMLLTSAGFAQTANVNPTHLVAAELQDEGDVVSKSELTRELPPDKDHPLPRKLIAIQEGELSCAPGPRKMLVAHYRAEPAVQPSMNDDRILIAAKQDNEFKVLKIVDSETAIVEENLHSDQDFDEEFIAINGMHFLYLRTRISGSGGIIENEVYTISGDQKLSIIPFQDVSKSKILKEGEELRNGGFRFSEGIFEFESGVYQPKDGECCPSQGDYHAQFRLEGEFKQDALTHAFQPNFQFVVAKDWRSNSH